MALRMLRAPSMALGRGLATCSGPLGPWRKRVPFFHQVDAALHLDGEAGDILAPDDKVYLGAVLGGPDLVEGLAGLGAISDLLVDAEFRLALWEEEIEPLLRGDPAGKLKATTIIEWLAELHPGRFSVSQLLTLQRRLQDWRALNGPEQEVYFPQEHPPGREAQIDFTHSNSLGVTIASQPLPPHAVPADTHPLGVALRRGHHRRDLPGVAAGYPVRPVDTGRGPPGGAHRQYFRRNS